MFYKNISAITIVIAILSSSCSTIEKLMYHPNINQGNFLTETNVKKIKNGMNQKEVIDILGHPILQDPFSTQTWFYIFRQQTSNNVITQQTLTLTFNNAGILNNIKNKWYIIK